MADKSNIEWTDSTWNPIVGCSIVSSGCTNCYAMKWAAKRFDQPHNQFPHYRGTTRQVNGNAVWTGKVALAPDHILTAPLGWKKPRRVFVNSMGDLFHESVPDEWIDKVFAVMALCPRHTFQVLTKRSKRMREYMTGGWQWRVMEAKKQWDPEHKEGYGGILNTKGMALRNVWLGVSAEDQARADERIPDLLATPAAVRFVSAEPLLGPVKFTRWMHDEGCPYAEFLGDCTCCDPREVSLDWIIVGGESGPRARPMHSNWARSIRDQCAAAGVAFFMKQWGEWAPSYDDTSRERLAVCEHGSGSFKIAAGERARQIDLLDRSQMHRVGKARAGRLLDGIEYNGFPEMKS
jgi:protein gp37